MDDFKIIARLFAAIRSCEGQPTFNCSLVKDLQRNAEQAQIEIETWKERFGHE